MYNNKNKKDYFRNRDFANPNFFNSNNESGDKRGRERATTSVSVRYDRNTEPDSSDANTSGTSGNQFGSASQINNVFNNHANGQQQQQQQEQQQQQQQELYQQQQPQQQQQQQQQQQLQQPSQPPLQEPATEISANGAENEHTDEADLEIAPHLHKHPLQNTWTLWYLENDRTKSWEEMQNEITSFDTVEDFWSLYNHIKTPSELKIGCDYSLFKKDIRPMWEDTANKQGGRWVITMNKNCKEDLDNIWLDVMLCLIGETFVNNEEVCGAVVNIRSKSNKISIWTANGNNKDAALEIGYKLRDTLHLRPQNLQYQSHKDTMVKQGSAVVKSIYVL